MVLPITPSFAEAPYQAQCTQPLPEFTLGEGSHPTKDQEAALCACIWSSLNQPDKATSQDIRERKLTDASSPEVQTFTRHFGDALEKCGGMKL
jgi:hypothetical protein